MISVRDQIGTYSQISIYSQWRIQDFPVGGHGPRMGGVDFRGGYILKILYVKTKESRPLGGRAPGTPPLDPPMLLKIILLNVIPMYK